MPSNRPPVRRIRYLHRLDQIEKLSPSERAELGRVAGRYAFRANDYYLGLIDWRDPEDPIRRLVVPHAEELRDGGSLDASDEAAVTVSRGVQHKYRDTALLLCTEVCSAYCRYCFRKRLFMEENDEVPSDLSAGLEYVSAHSEIAHVVLSGGDPLSLGTPRLREILEALLAIPHVETIRIGSKIPAFDPWRILDDPELQELLEASCTPRKRIYLMAHFDHPRELTDAAVDAIAACLRAGVICANQNPLLRGINDDAEVLAALFRKLTAIGCPPYYLFQGRPTVGNEPYAVPLVRGFRIFRDALRRGSGLESRVRFVMSHATGKLEVLGVDDERILLRYHRAADPAQFGRILVCKRDDAACWLDDLHVREEF
jgi:lysine 2,3-aminomutase